jgi:hypothetical protein
MITTHEHSSAAKWMSVIYQQLFGNWQTWSSRNNCMEKRQHHNHHPFFYRSTLVCVYFPLALKTKGWDQWFRILDDDWWNSIQWCQTTGRCIWKRCQSGKSHPITSILMQLKTTNHITYVTISFYVVCLSWLYVSDVCLLCKRNPVDELHASAVFFKYFKVVRSRWVITSTKWLSVKKSCVHQFEKKPDKRNLKKKRNSMIAKCIWRLVIANPGN